MWECGLKHLKVLAVSNTVKSLLMWECGLKHIYLISSDKGNESLLMWECGLKHQSNTSVRTSR